MDIEELKSEISLLKTMNYILEVERSAMQIKEEEFLRQDERIKQLESFIEARGYEPPKEEV